jgi:hypothetical protein
MQKTDHVAPPPGEAWNRLVATLEAATTCEDDPKLPPDMTQILVVLLGFQNYLAASEVSERERLVLPLLRLLTAIHELSEGRQLPLFKPRKQNGNPGKSASQSNLMAIAALALDRLIEAGSSNDRAVKCVVSALRGRVPSVIEKPTTVLDWRYRLREGAGGRAPEDALKRYCSPLTMSRPAFPILLRT